MSDREQQQNDRGLRSPLIRAIPSGGPVRTRPDGLSRQRISCHNSTPGGAIGSARQHREVLDTHTGPVSVRMSVVIATEYHHADRQPSFRGLGPFLRFFPSFPPLFSPGSESGPAKREHLWQLYLNIYADCENTRMLSPTTDSATHTKNLLLTSLPVFLELVKEEWRRKTRMGRPRLSSDPGNADCNETTVKMSMKKSQHP